MKDENNKLDSHQNEYDKHPLSKQTDIWFGKRHRAWYFITGFGLAAVISWYLFLPSVLDQTRKSYDRIYLDQDTKIDGLQKQVSQMTTEVNIFKDSIEQMRDFGTLWGEFDVPFGNDKISIYGKILTGACQKRKEGYSHLTIYIDTCYGYDLYFSDPLDSNCVVYRYFLPLSLNKYSPLIIGDMVFNIYCTKIEDEFVTIELYRKD